MYFSLFSKLIDYVEQMKVCVYCTQNLAHPSWVYLTTHRNFHPLKQQQPSPVYIGITKSVFQNLKCLNRVSNYRTGSKNSKAISPFHQLEGIMGPIWGKNAKDFKKIIQQKARKTITRLKLMKQIAIENNLTLYARDVEVFKQL